MILLIIFIVSTMFLLYAWACIIVHVNQYCSTLTSVFNMYFSYLIHYLFYCNFPALLSATQNSFKFITAVVNVFYRRPTISVQDDVGTLSCVFCVSPICSSSDMSW